MKNISLFFVFIAFMEGVFSESVSVTEGDSVTLKTDTEIPTDDFIDWRFGGTLIARVTKAGKPTFNDVLDGKFNGRLTLDNQTGDLTISKTKTSDSGEYKVSNRVDSIQKTFTVSVSAVVPKPDPESGLSSGGIAGIVLAVIAVVAAVGGGIGYGYWKKGQML